MSTSDEYSVYFHHGGKFVIAEGFDEYVGGRITSKHGIDVDRFGYLDLVEEVEKLGYVSWNSLRFRDTINHCYKIINDDKEVLELFSQMKKYVSIYIDDGAVKIDDVDLSMGIEGDNGVTMDVTMDGKAMLSSDDELNTFIETYFDGDGGLDNDAQNDDSESDGLDDNELASGDEEYIQVRQDRRIRRRRKVKGKGIDEPNVQPVEVVSDYDTSDGEVNSISSGSEISIDEETGKRKKMLRLQYDPLCDHKELKFKLGMSFVDAAQCKVAIRKYSLVNGHPISFTRSNQHQIGAKCIPECGWRIYASLMRSDKKFVVKMVTDNKHLCTRQMNNKQATAEWIATEYLEHFRKRPNLEIELLEDDIIDKFAAEPSKWKLYRARASAKKKLSGTTVEHYARMWSYLAELKRVDPEGRFELRLDTGNVFEAFYYGLSALTKGFKEGCRSIIGFDGCFLKAGVGGMLLNAVSKDGNNQMFPIAWAVVDVENQANWTWFLSILFEELGIGDGGGWTFISDQQKGLINAVTTLTPHAEHRNCARHVYSNWKKNFKGANLKTAFWRAARSTYVDQYKLALDDMKTIDIAAHDDFVDREPVRFCKAFISTRCHCDMIDNNISETFNGYILKARQKPIIDMLEEIRGQLMSRQYTKHTAVEDSTARLCPAIHDKLEKLKYSSRLCNCMPALHRKFQVQHMDDQFIVDMGSKTCSCRIWDITGIPCIHACSAITFLKEDHQNYVANCYTLERYKMAYSHGITPLNGYKMWPVVDGDPVKPPHHKVMPGRPKKNRKKGIEEKDCEGRTKLPRLGLTMTCQNCQGEGHNKRTCKNPQVMKPPKLVKRGRPRKMASEDQSQHQTQSGLKRGRPRKMASEDQSQHQTQSGLKRGRPRKMTSGDQSQYRDQGSNIFRERAQARQGMGVLVGDSGNAYVRGSMTNKSITQVSADGNASASRGRSQSRNCGRGRRGGRGCGSGIARGSAGRGNMEETQESCN